MHRADVVAVEPEVAGDLFGGLFAGGAHRLAISTSGPMRAGRPVGAGRVELRIEAEGHLGAAQGGPDPVAEQPEQDAGALHHVGQRLVEVEDATEVVVDDRVLAGGPGDQVERRPGHRGEDLPAPRPQGLGAGGALVAPVPGHGHPPRHLERLALLGEEPLEEPLVQRGGRLQLCPQDQRRAGGRADALGVERVEGADRVADEDDAQREQPAAGRSAATCCRSNG